MNTITGCVAPPVATVFAVVVADGEIPSCGGGPR